MIGTIRKHSKWLWWLIAGATIISFVIFMGSGPMRGSGGGGDYGSIYGQKITPEEFNNALREFKLFYWFHNPGQWPDRLPETQLERETYVRVLLFRKAEQLGIHVSEAAAAARAAALLHSLDRNGQGVSLQAFVKQILAPEGLTEGDFARFAGHDLAIEELVNTLGLPGALVTPQEAAADWRRDHQARAAEAVFFSASNYLAQVTAPPDAVARFYTNNLAAYRLPDRVQVSYVEFNESNYLAAAEREIGTTNLDLEVENLYRRNGLEAVPDARTPEEAKAKIREFLLHKQALADAHQRANEFASAVYNLTPVRPENLAAVAREKGLPVKTTRPFGELYGPDEFPAPASFIKAAFALSPDDPFAGPIEGPSGYYVIALDKRLPSEIPSLDTIRDRVAQDYRMAQAIAQAQRDGTNFAATLTAQLAAGRSFAAVCVAAGRHPVVLPPFSLSTAELPDDTGPATLNELKQAVFSTPVGQMSGFVPTEEGGFIIFVEKELPVDLATMNADLPQYLQALRRVRQNEAFDLWLSAEAKRQLGGIPAFQQAVNAARGE